jgi:hypothetical protein
MAAAVLSMKIIYINSLIQKVPNVQAIDIFQVKLNNRFNALETDTLEVC